MNITVQLKLLFIVLFSACWLLACGQQPEYPALPANANVVILGDSLTYGTGASKGEDYPSLLAQHTGWHITNAGVPGNRTADGLERLDDLLEASTSEQKIDLLIVELGGNDFLQHVPEQQTIDHLREILSKAKAQRVQTILIAIPQFSPVGAAFGNLEDHPLYAKIAEETGTPLVENLFSEVLTQNRLKADYVHPNAEGYRMIAQNLHEALVALGFAIKKN